MNCKVVTVCDNPGHEGAKRLIASLQKFGYEYEVLVVPFTWGGQMKTIYDWTKKNTGTFLYTDAYDTFALGPMPFIPTEKMFVSAESNCYPNASLAPQYPTTEFYWKYVNAGGWITTCEYFSELYEKTHHWQDNDQAWLTRQLLSHPDEIKLDYNCDIFQSIAFEHPSYFSFEDGRLINNYTKRKPIFLHGNGRTDMRPIEDKLLKSVKC